MDKPGMEHTEADGIGIADDIPIPKPVAGTNSFNPPKKRLVLKYKKNLEFEMKSENLKKAIDQVNKGFSLRQAGMKFGVPFSTLRQKMRKNITDYKNHGPATILSTSDEENLAKLIQDLIRRNMNPTINAFLDHANKIFKLYDPEKNKDPETHQLSSSWVRHFIERYLFLEVKRVNWIESEDFEVTEADINSWFERTDKYFQNIPIIELTLDRIINCDVIFLPFDPTGETTKEGISVLFSVLANGCYLKPQIMFKWRAYKNFVDKYIDHYFYHVVSGQDKVIREKIFLNYIKDNLVPEMKDRGAEFPIILYIDNPTCHFSLNLSIKCQELNVILISLHPNSKHFYQPCTVGIFKELYEAWIADASKEESICTKETFGSRFRKCVERVVSKDLVKSSFEKCGLSWPLNPNVLDYSKLKDPVPESAISFMEDHDWKSDRYVFYERDLTMLEEELEGSENEEEPEESEESEESEISKEIPAKKDDVAEAVPKQQTLKLDIKVLPSPSNFLGSTSHKLGTVQQKPDPLVPPRIPKTIIYPPNPPPIQPSIPSKPKAINLKDPESLATHWRICKLGRVVEGPQLYENQGKPELIKINSNDKPKIIQIAPNILLIEPTGNPDNRERFAIVSKGAPIKAVQMKPVHLQDGSNHPNEAPESLVEKRFQVKEAFSSLGIVEERSTPNTSRNFTYSDPVSIHVNLPVNSVDPLAKNGSQNQQNIERSQENSSNTQSIRVRDITQNNHWVLVNNQFPVSSTVATAENSNPNQPSSNLLFNISKPKKFTEIRKIQLPETNQEANRREPKSLAERYSSATARNSRLKERIEDLKIENLALKTANEKLKSKLDHFGKFVFERYIWEMTMATLDKSYNRK